MKVYPICTIILWEAKKTNKSDKTYLNRVFLLSFLEPENFNDMPISHNEEELSQCDEEISGYQEMLHYYLEEDNKEEIKNWKQLLQQAKTRKRILRYMIENNLTERDLIA